MKYIIALLFLTMPVLAQNSATESLLFQKNEITTEKAEKLPQILPDKPEKKSGMLAVLYSLILPGMGELYGGNYSSGKYFTIADGVIWGVFAGYNIYGNWQRNNYKAFAQSNGGVSPAGKDATYYANLGDYISQEEYNRRQGLDANFSGMYNGEQYYWNWASQSQRQEYRGMWESSEQAFNDVRFAVGALIVNRIISAFNAARIVRNYNKNIDTQTSWNLSMSLTPRMNVMPSTLNLNFQTTF
ncbi:MAG: hypothetical protein HF314_04900 [Ignavibacteria bacterium]|jgi:hypothetical protein|nr:hypothetical protein [Ignavibacteria bacterium]MCU7502388.1 hypothetical protein [Ignavibacteria bacterium]MCU7515047.1 hypothetical protein [Ignavibacteria bacterium]